ncbi:MAG: glycerophosphodiester phosphodiesterase, partial [Frankiales bacterium]|nr:glycerophosphodiester phosphodiesterase [Frankiales bacterium]
VYDVEDVSLQFDGRVLYDHVTWRVGPGDRVGIVGVNGAGKSTLLKLLVGQLQPDSGVVKVGQTVKVAYLSQEVAELDPVLRVLEAVQQVANSVDLGGKPVGASSLCDRFGFTGNAQWTRVGDLSGGERRRLQVLRLLMGEPNVLLLDEPTNDLDIDTLNALEDVLDGWPGTLLVVSHDRYFLERVTNVTSSLMGDGSVKALPGGVEQYLAERVRRSNPSVSANAKDTAPKGDPRAAKKELSRVEREIAKIDKEEAALHTTMAAKASDHAAVLALDEELRVLQEKKAALEDTWMELYEQVES